MKQYSLKGNTGEAKFVFNPDGRLIKYEAQPDMEDAALIWLNRKLPATYDELELLASQFKFTLVEVPMDLSFDTFYNAYNYKVGNKKRAQKLWDELSDADKVLAIVKIPLYDRYLKVKSNMEKVYPETYLSQRRFESQWK